MAEAAPEPLLDIAEIQGHILPGFGSQPTILLGVARRERANPESAAVLRRWLRSLAPAITPLAKSAAMRELRRTMVRSSGVMPRLPELYLSVALGAPVLPALQLPSDRIREAAFLRGMAGANLGHEKGDDGRPVGWVVGASAEETPEVLLTVGCDDAAVLAAAVAELEAGLPPELAVIFRQEGAPLPGDIEHFGFRDGISQPGVRGRLSEDPQDLLTRRYFSPNDPRAAYEAKPGQPLIWPGQFLFGYPTQVDLDPATPGPLARPPHEWMKNGAYLAFQRLRQDVKALRDFSKEEAARVSQELGREVPPAELEAWMVGRWPDGTPLTRSPQGPDPAIVSDRLAINFFGYGADESEAEVIEGDQTRRIAGVAGDNAGLRCPHFAHIRKVNTRDKGTDLGSPTRFRILRRGVPFGPLYCEGEAPGVERGLIFLSYQRSLHPQFLTLFATWMNQSDAPEGQGHDLLVGQSASPRFGVRSLPEGSCTLRATGRNPWVISTGGGFFFTPAISVLANLMD